MRPLFYGVSLERARLLVWDGISIVFKLKIARKSLKVRNRVYFLGLLFTRK